MRKMIWKRVAAILLVLAMTAGSGGFTSLAGEIAAGGEIEEAVGTDETAGIAAEQTADVASYVAADGGNEPEMISGLTEPQHDQPGHVHVGETLYMVDIYPKSVYTEGRDISYVKAQFYDKEPVLVTDKDSERFRQYIAADGAKVKEIYMTHSSLHYSVKIPQHEDTTAENINSDDRPRYNWVCFEIHLTDGSILYHQRTYNIMGESETYNKERHVVSFPFQKDVSDTVFVGRNLDNQPTETGFMSRSYIGVHPDSSVSSLMGKKLFINFEGIADPSGYTLNWGDNVREFVTDANKASAENTWFYKFTADDKADEFTLFTLKDKDGKEIVRFNYSSSKTKNMLLVESLANNTGAWSTYQAVVGEKRYILVNNITAKLSEASIRWTTAEVADTMTADELQGDTNWENWQALTGPTADFHFYWDQVPAERAYIQIKGTYNGTEYLSAPVRMSDTMMYDYPCFYARRVVSGGEKLLDGYWGNALDIASGGDSVQEVPVGTFTKDADTYYATADFYDYYSGAEIEGIALKNGGITYDNYSRQADYVNEALSDYYQKHNWDVSDYKYPLYIGDTYTFGGTVDYYEFQNIHTVNGWNADINLACGMVDSSLTNGNLTQHGKVVPYFSEEFLRGDNKY